MNKPRRELCAARLNLCRLAEQVVDHLVGGIAIAARDALDARHVIAARNERQLLAIVTHLRVTRIRHQPVAQAFAALGLLDGAAFFHERGHRLCRAAVTEAAVGPLIRYAQVAEIADSLALFVVLGLRIGALDLHDLEGKSRR